MPRSIAASLGSTSLIALGVVLAAAAPAAAQARPDLRISALGAPPATGLPGDSFLVTTTVVNEGAAPAGASTTKFFLVPTTGTARKNLKGTQAVPGLAPLAPHDATVTVGIFSDTLPGTYALQACADGDGVLAESSEADNCFTTAGTITVQEVPDLVVTAIGNPPSGAAQGQAFEVSATVQNAGGVPAIASTTKFFLVPAGGGARRDLKGTQAVPALDPAATFTEPVTVTVRPETVPGSYRLQACADNGKVVTETSEDNCATSLGTVQVSARPDLVVTAAALAGGPVALGPGGSFAVDATVLNQGLIGAPESSLKFRLVHTTTAAEKSLTGTQAVEALADGASQVTQTTVTVFEDTAFGTYAVEVCVDPDRTVPEATDSNNCARTTGTVTVQDMAAFQGDFVVNALTDPPATGRRGDSFAVTARVRNRGAVELPASETTFGLRAEDGTRKSLRGVQAVGALAPLTATAPSATVAIASDTPPGTYVLEACADGRKLLAEANEGNNCRRTTATITVIVEPMADLEVTALSDPPAALDPGERFQLTSTVKNVSAIDAAGSLTRYYLVPVGGGERRELRNGHQVPALLAGAEFTDSHQVVVRGDTPGGTYRLQACADTGKVIAEGDEDNCRTSAGTIDVTPVPDVTVTSVAIPGSPLSVARGAAFTVTAVVANQGSGAAVASTTRYFLVRVNAASPTRGLINGGAVGPLDPGAAETTHTSVVVMADTPLGLYAVQACADWLKVVDENFESNNCATSSQTVTIVR